jgi:hypothetical protein
LLGIWSQQSGATTIDKKRQQTRKGNLVPQQQEQQKFVPLGAFKEKSDC